MQFVDCGRYLEELGRLARRKTALALYRAETSSENWASGDSGRRKWASEDSNQGDVTSEDWVSENSALACETGIREKEFFAAGERALQGDLFLPMQYLVEIAGCSAFERHCVLMGLGYELGYPSRAECVRINGSETQTGLTPRLLVWAWQEHLGPDMVCRAFRDGSLLMRMFFRWAGGESPFLEQELCLKPRVRAFLMGNLSLSGDAALVMGDCFPEVGSMPLDPGQPDVAGLLSGDWHVVQLWGPGGSGRCYSARAACVKMGRRSFPVYPEEAFAGGWTSGETAEQILLESLLFQALPILRLPGRWERQDQERELWLGMVLRSLAGTLRPVFLASPRKLGERELGGMLQIQSFEMGAMSAAQAGRVWREEARPYRFVPGLHPQEMAQLFRFTRGQIREALHNADQDARRSRGASEGIGHESLRRGCYSLFESRLVTRAVRVPCEYRWEDLILPAAQKEKLQAAAGQVRRRHQVYEEWGFCKKMPYGQGLSMIFAGPPGTGKTMAAQVFAGELGLELYKVELSAVVSKYVGETEKNLNEIFSQAQRSQVALFFDEADVLFSKRTEVKEANDKYSNMEAAFLLQKIESYEGVTVLATNLIQNFDEAFKRRMRFIVEFPFPGKEERREIWRRAIPEEMPAEELDEEYLAETFELSGSNIRSCVLHAAFLAAERGKSVGMEEILQGIRNEYAKNGKSLTRGELGEYFMLLPEIG